MEPSIANMAQQINDLMIQVISLGQTVNELNLELINLKQGGTESEHSNI